MHYPHCSKVPSTIFLQLELSLRIVRRSLLDSIELATMVRINLLAIKDIGGNTLNRDLETLASSCPVENLVQALQVLDLLNPGVQFLSEYSMPDVQEVRDGIEGELDVG